MTRKQILFVLLATLILVLAPAACSTAGGQSLQIDSPAPDFTLTDLSGRSVSLSSLRGKYVFINFWSTTCGPCVNEMPILQELHDDWSAGSEAVVVTVDIGENRSTVENFVRQHNYSFPVWLDSQYAAAEIYSVQYTPTTFFIDPEGRLKFKVVGPFPNKAAVEKQVREFIRNPAD